MPTVSDEPDDALDVLADHCLAAHAIIGEHGSPVMRRLIDLLLFEVGVAIAARIDERDDPVRRNGGSI